VRVEGGLCHGCADSSRHQENCKLAESVWNVKPTPASLHATTPGRTDQAHITEGEEGGTSQGGTGGGPQARATGPGRNQESTKKDQHEGQTGARPGEAHEGGSEVHGRGAMSRGQAKGGVTSTGQRGVPEGSARQPEGTANQARRASDQSRGARASSSLGAGPEGEVREQGPRSGSGKQQGTQPEGDRQGDSQGQEEKDRGVPVPGVWYRPVEEGWQSEAEEKGAPGCTHARWEAGERKGAWGRQGPGGDEPEPGEEKPERQWEWESQQRAAGAVKAARASEDRESELEGGEVPVGSETPSWVEANQAVEGGGSREAQDQRGIGAGSVTERPSPA
jgi:hypothetical protein